MSSRTHQADVRSPRLDDIAEVLKLAGWRVLSWIGSGALAAALLIPAWQTYTWLQTGNWPNLTLASLILPRAEGTDFGAWLSAPQSWYGLQRVVRFLFGLPLWMWMVALFYLVIATGAEVPPAKKRARST